MKSIDLNKLKDLPGRQIGEKDTFSFRCYPGIGCYNRCCRNLNLFLYPYDVLRLKNALDISSDEFLDRYVDVVLRSNNFFPEVLLRMADNPEKTCPAWKKRDAYDFMRLARCELFFLIRYRIILLDSVSVVTNAI